MTSRELILNFVNQYRKPFDVPLIANMTGLEITDVEPIIAELIADKTVKLISNREPIYARSNRYCSYVSQQIRPGWQLDPKAALALVNLIDQGPYKSIRSIAEAFGRSRQWVFVYLEALASMGVVGINQHGYCVLTKRDLNEVSVKIKRGILKELGAHWAELRKEQNLQDKIAAWHLKLNKPEPLEKEMEVFDGQNQASMMKLNINKRNKR